MSEYCSFCLRLPSVVHRKMQIKVFEKKETNRKYSINKYITELIMKDLYGDKYKDILIQQLLSESGFQNDI